MKNLNKLAFGVLVGAMALGMSAFTNAKPIMNNAKTIPAGFLVQTANGQYEYRSSLSTDGDCLNNANNPCHYQVSSSNNLPTKATYSTTDISTYSGVSNPQGGNKLWVE